ncbi:MAG: host-nuclease inhibitor Gam family protein [Roseburia sp.]|nr:host-nuclease inhibitor Gam family protein [Roseburia sp.]
MARKKIAASALGSWEDVNESLKVIGEAENEIAAIEAEMNNDIAKIKAAAKVKVKEHENVIKVQELMIQQYASAHREDMKEKTYKLAFGSVGYRLSTRLILPKEIKPIIENLRKRGMMDCLSTEVKVNKDVLNTYSEADIVAVGGKLKKKDTFWYKTAKDTVQDK